MAMGMRYRLAVIFGLRESLWWLVIAVFGGC